jgi:hypothetical protein
MAGLGLLGPEFIFQLALRQWSSARRSVEAFKELGHVSCITQGHQDWSMAHAFLADMGGFVLDVEGYENFPLHAKQVHYLVKKGYVNYEEVGLSKEAITDKNKGEALVRFITVVQIL